MSGPYVGLHGDDGSPSGYISHWRIIGEKTIVEKKIDMVSHGYELSVVVTRSIYRKENRSTGERGSWKSRGWHPGVKIHTPEGVVGRGIIHFPEERRVQITSNSEYVSDALRAFGGVEVYPMRFIFDY